MENDEHERVDRCGSSDGDLPVVRLHPVLHLTLPHRGSFSISFFSFASSFDFPFSSSLNPPTPNTSALLPQAQVPVYGEPDGLPMVQLETNQQAPTITAAPIGSQMYVPRGNMNVEMTNTTATRQHEATLENVPLLNSSGH